MRKLCYRNTTIQLLSSAEAASLLDSGYENGRYEPQGSCLTFSSGKVIAIDNGTRNAWTEEFCRLKCALTWLLGLEGCKEVPRHE